MDTQIEEIIFLPSLRCNLNCKHCGEKQDIGKTEEIDCDLVLEQIQKSCLFHGTSVQISGGEPFLNDTFQNFLVRGLRETRLFFYITSNGYFYEKIMNVINQITPHERQRLGFSISVDGFEKTHNHIRRNSISYQNAITTVKHLVEQDVPVSINTVAQPQNLDELQKMTEFVHGISPKVGHSVIPLALDISEDDKEEYTDQYTDVVWKYVTSIADKKRLLSKGKFGVKKCHAGMKNIVIASNGGVYPCLTGAFYREREMRDRICLGNLKEMSLDEILINEKRDKIYENEIVNCGGCTNPCEVNREINLFQQGLHLYENEIADVMRLEETEKIGDAVLDYEDWHAIEHYGENRTLCWSRNSIARVFLPVLENAVIRVQYRKLISGQRIKIFVNGKEVLYDNEDLTNSFYIEPMETGKSYYTIQFISQMLCPMELNINEDRRYLGIGLEDVRWCDRRC